MNVTDTAVTHAAHLSLFMVKVSYRYLREVRQRDPACSLLDLKAWIRADTYVTETIQMLPEKPEPVLLAKIFNKVAGIGRIHVL
jgi:putative transposase